MSLQYGSATSPTDSGQPGASQVAAPTPTAARKTGRVPCWIRAPGDDEIARRVADANPAPVDDTSQVSVLQERFPARRSPFTQTSGPDHARAQPPGLRALITGGPVSRCQVKARWTEWIAPTAAGGTDVRAHGSGGQYCSCQPPGKTALGHLAGERMGVRCAVDRCWTDFAADSSTGRLPAHTVTTHRAKRL